MMTKLHAYVCRLELTAGIAIFFAILVGCIAIGQAIWCHNNHCDKLACVRIEGKRLPRNVGNLAKFCDKDGNLKEPVMGFMKPDGTISYRAIKHKNKHEWQGSSLQVLGRAND